QHHPQGVAPDGPRLILHDPPIQKKAPLRRFLRFCCPELNVPDENLPQVRLNRRERFRLMRQHHPQGVAPDGPRLILHDPPIQNKAPLRRFFVSAAQS
ncbi:hypothetical protein, partial [Pantoea brenneri]|uniref:hypothetical protein n=1 Tax=Pantoea brenneri TaxID=472694 RepID=UPI00289CF035